MFSTIIATLFSLVAAGNLRTIVHRAVVHRTTQNESNYGDPLAHTIVHSTNESNYGDPLARTCLSNEMNISVEGINGWFCSPVCTTNPCPTDTPASVTAKPTCDIQDGQTGDMLCGLVCTSNVSCGHNSTCKDIADTALCTYDK